MTVRRRRLAVAWGVVGALAASVGAVYAFGVATSVAEVDASSTKTTPILGRPAVVPQTPNPYFDLVTSPSPLAVTESDGWGVIAEDHVVFEVDLTGEAGDPFRVDILVDEAPTGWASAQVKWLQLPCPGGAAGLTSADFDAAYAEPVAPDPGAPKLMDVLAVDALAAFDGVAAGARWCFGVKDMPVADDPAGTSLVAAGSPVTSPVFAAVLFRAPA